MRSICQWAFLITAVNLLAAVTVAQPPKDKVLNAWLATLNGGARQEDVLVGLVSSLEYYAKHGSGDTAFIRSLYEDVLARSASSAEDSPAPAAGSIARE